MVESVTDDIETWTNYKLIKQLGCGAYSTVWEAIHVPTNTPVAIKKEVDVFQNLVDCKRILREVMLLRKLQHPNVVRILDFFVDHHKSNFTSLYLVLELADASINDLANSPIFISEGQVKKIFYTMLLGLKYIESAGVLHRDLKPANVLIYEDCSSKICDFGLSRTALEISCPLALHRMMLKKSKEEQGEGKVEGVKKGGSKKGSPTKAESPVEEVKSIKRHMLKKPPEKKDHKKRLSNHVVTRWYRAPEVVLLQKDYGHAVDVWAAGCIFAELIGLKKESEPNYYNRKPLFPGSACYPLSPASSQEEEKQDQLGVILSVIGSPTEKDCHFIEDKELIKGLLKMPTQSKMSLDKKYPGSGKDAIDLLSKMLTFDPYARLTIEECLAHPYLASIRRKKSELTSLEPVELEIEKVDKLDEAALRKYFLAEDAFFAKRKFETNLEASK